MNDLLVLVLHNTIVATVLACFVYGLTRVWRNPPVAHWLWLLVLLKLVAPPLWRVDWPALWFSEATRAHGQTSAGDTQSQGPVIERRARFVTRPMGVTSGHPSSVALKEHGFAASVRPYWQRARPILLWLWLGGAAVCLLVAVLRIVRFERLLRETLPASDRLRRLTAELAGKLRVRRVPDVRCVSGVTVPMLWWAGRRATVVLPMRLLTPPDDERLALILAHELAHLRRRDHWVRVLELAVSAIYWWNPVVRLVRRQMHQAEDVCCDAWVRWAMPDSAKRYAEILFDAAESLSRLDVGARLLPASPLLRYYSLKARIEMILQSPFVPFASKQSLVAVALLAVVVWPSFVVTTSRQGRAAEEKATAAAGDERDSKTSEFPYAVQFEQGATKFLAGDEISIIEVRGTAETFLPGNIYWIRGKYKLGSCDRAMVAAYTTAMDAENGTSGSLKVQTTVVDRGDGTFTLFLPMSYRGWPHVSFYPAGGGSGFGGNYFGTGDSVLKRWWGAEGQLR